MLTRFELVVILRNQVADRDAVRRAFAVEATMEELAGALAGDKLEYALAGLGTGLDAELTAGNQGRRGGVAAELLLCEGASQAVAAAVAARADDDVQVLAPLALALAAAEGVVAQIYAGFALGDTLDTISARSVAVRARRAAEQRAEPAAQRLVAAAARLGLDVERLATLALDGLRRVREDLRR